MQTYETTIECCGREYHAEIEHEIDGDGDICIYKVEMQQQVNHKGGVWYDRNGHPHFGDKFIYLDVTEWLDATQKAALVDEIKTERRAKIEEDKAEQWYDRKAA